MKKLTLIVSALALLIGFSQCKKDEITPNVNDNRIQITLNANYGGNGSKTTFNPANGTFKWLTGDGPDAIEYINVGGSQSGYLGQLNNNDNKGTGTFNGSITTPENGETLYFFYLGNGNHANATTVDFSNQNGIDVTNCHIAIGSQDYNGQTEFSATLNMAMAIAYFDLSRFNNDSKSAETVYLSGNDVYSTASINYKEGTITGNSKGQIKLGTANNGMYVALIPSVTTSTTLNFNSSSKTGSMTFNNGIKTGYYYTGDSYSALTVSAETGTGIPGTFSVSATKKVFFSKGNLQYTRKTTSDDWSTGVWSFMTNQYDVVETGNVSANYDSQTAVSLFGWGTSGYDEKYPYMTNYAVSDYYNNDINNTYYDWGKYNSSNITNGSGYTTWRILTIDEWTYLLGPSSKPQPGTNCRIVNNNLSNEVEVRFVLATIADTYKGMIVFPDKYSHPNTVEIGGTPVYNNKSNYTATISSIDDWTEMANAGAVFLPASGYRYGYSNPVVTYNSDKIYYWSGDNGAGDYGKCITLSDNMFSVPNQSIKRIYGLAVRLVRDVE